MRGTSGSWKVLGLAAIFAAALVALPAAAQDGDAAVAAALLKSGKAALAKKSWDEAVTLFDRALRESPELVEAEYQKAVALEKKGARAEALAAYRRFLERLKEKSDGGGAAADEKALGPLAEKRVASLAMGEQELAKLETQFGAQLLAFAKKCAPRDPQLAVRALRILLEGQPGHAEARALLEKLGGSADAPAAPDPAPSGAGPFASLPVDEWHDLIERKTFGTSALDYREPGFVLDTAGGKVVQPVEHVEYGARYAYECEFRVAEEKERGWLVGLVFGLRQGDFRSAFVQRGQVVVTAGNLGSGPSADVGSAPLKTIDLAAWHRLGVKVDGAKMEVWLDGARLLSLTEGVRPDLSGDIGLFQQRCRVEWRLLRAGAIR